jgi:hypothetical protein
VVLGLLTQRQQILRWSLRLGLSALLFLTVLAAAHKFGLPVREIPLVGRLALIIPLGENTGDHFRSSLWRAAATFLTEPAPLLLPQGTEDPHAALQPWISYGPDTIEAILPSRWIHFSGWPRPYIEVSCHSIFWDWFLTLGALGLVLGFLFFGTILGVALDALGLLPRNPKSRWRFAAWLLAGTCLGGATLTFLLHPGFLGLGAQFGLLAGCILFLLREHQTSSLPRNQRDLSNRTGFLLALLAGLLAHWVDLTFLFSTPGAAFLFWIAAGGILGASVPQAQEFLAPQWFWIYAGQGFMHRRLGHEDASQSAFAAAATVEWADRPFDPAAFQRLPHGALPEPPQF